MAVVLNPQSTSFQGNAALNINSRFNALVCGGGTPEIDMRDTAIESKSAFLQAVAKVNDAKEQNNKPLDQLILSGGFESSDAFQTIDKGILTFKDKSTMTIAEVAKEAVSAGSLKKDGMLVINAKVFNEQDDAYTALKKAASDAKITIVANARDKGGTYIFNSDGTVKHSAEGSISSSIGLRGECGGGYKP